MTATAALATNTLLPSQLHALLVECIPAKEPVLVVGQPAIGKTEIIKQAAHTVGAKILLMHPVISDPTDFKGLPVVLQDGADFAPIGDLRKLISATELTVCFMDDLGQAPESVQAAAMQLVLERRIGQHVVSPHVVFIAATNRRADRASVRGLIEPLKSRFTIVELVTCMDEWRPWALRSGIADEIIAYLNLKEEFLAHFEPTADMVNSPSPRTWHAVSRHMQLNHSPVVLAVVIKGCVGHTVGTEFTGFLRIWRDMVSPHVVLSAPDTADIPKNPAALVALATAVAQRVQEASLPAYDRYMKRLIAASHSEYVAISMRTITSRPDATKLANTRAYIDLASGPVGRLLIGGTTN
jgi:hypothetical protein